MDGVLVMGFGVWVGAMVAQIDQFAQKLRMEVSSQANKLSLVQAFMTSTLWWAESRQSGAFFF